LKFAKIPMRKILIAPSTFAQVDTAPLDKLIANDFEIIRNPFGRKLIFEELQELLKGVEGIVAGLEDLDRKILNGSSLKVISRCGAGLDNIDLEAARELGIRVFSTPDAPTNAVAELTVGIILSLLRNIIEMDKDLHNGRWSKKTGWELKDKAVAIIGFGRIGRRVAELLKPFKPRIIAIDPVYNTPVEGIEVFSLEEALPQSDIITVHASASKTILGEKEFSLMRRGVFLINCSRGSVINEQALIKALDDAKVSAAWLDCFSEEPYTGPLTKYPQVILTPHIGSYTAECRRQMEMEAVDNLIRAFKERG